MVFTGETCTKSVGPVEVERWIYTDSRQKK